jgi:hypothetical protein
MQIETNLFDAGLQLFMMIKPTQTGRNLGTSMIL